MNIHLKRKALRIVPLCIALFSAGCGGGNDEIAYDSTPTAPLPARIQSVEFFTLSEAEDTIHIGDLFENPNILSFADATSTDTVYEAPIVSGNFADTLNATVVTYTPATGSRKCWFAIQDLSYTPATGHTITSYLFEVIVETYDADARELTGQIQNIYITCSEGNVIEQCISDITKVTFQMRDSDAGTGNDTTVEAP